MGFEIRLWVFIDVSAIVCSIDMTCKAERARRERWPAAFSSLDNLL